MRELKSYKEELAAVAIISTLLLLVRWASATWWPTTGQYDLAAETETVVWTVLRMVIYTCAAWLGLRVVLPKGYRWLKNQVYDSFDAMPSEAKTNLSLRTFAMLLLVLVLLAMSACNTATAATLSPQRACVVENALADVDVREASGHNDGPEVERYLASVGLHKGLSWCAAFVSYHLSGCGVRNPATGWSPAFSGVSARIWSPRKAIRMPMPGDVFTLWYSSLGRVGHTGFVTGFDGRYISTVEGNTSAPGSREGDGVYARRRQLSKVYAVTNYIHDEAPADLERATGARRLPNAAQRDHRYQADHRNGDQAGAQGYAAAGAEGQRASAAAAAGAGAGRASKDQAQGPRHHYGEREPRRGASGLRVRHGQHQSAAVGPLYAHEQGHGDHYQGGGGEVPNARLGVVAAGPGGGLHRAATGTHEPQVFLIQ